MLNIVIFMRGFVAIIFGTCLLINRCNEISSGVSWVGIFAMFDGLLGGVLTAILISRSANFVLTTLSIAEATARFLIGSLLFLNPIFLNSFLGSVFFLTGTILVCFTVGIACTAGLLILRIIGNLSFSNRSVFISSIGLSLMAFFLGFGLFYSASDEERRTVTACFALVTGLIFIYISFRKKLLR